MALRQLRRCFLSVAIPLVAFGAATALPAAAQLANSVTEFSGVQGQNNWNYGFYDRTNDVGGVYNPLTDYALMTQFNGTAWQVNNGTFWTELNSQGGHPNGTTTSGGRTPVEHWAIRRYTSEVTGLVNISGTLAKSSTGGGNGIIGRIFVDGTEVFTQTIAATDGVGVNYNFSQNVNLGSRVDFVIDPNASNDISDGTVFTAQVSSVVVAAPEASTLALCVGGLLPIAGAVIKKRRRNA